MREMIKRKNKLLYEASMNYKKVKNCTALLRERRSLSPKAAEALVELVTDQLSICEDIELDLYLESTRKPPEEKKEGGDNE